MKINRLNFRETCSQIKPNLREHRRHVDAANTLAIRYKNSNVALLAPGGAPRILNNPVLSASALFNSIAYKDDCSVLMGRAHLNIVYNASLVLEPSIVASKNTDRNSRDISDCGFQLE